MRHLKIPSAKEVFGLLLPVQGFGQTALNTDAGAEDQTIRFRVHVPQEALDDLQLARYWEKTYDWRKAEAKLNALPEFVTTIDGVDVQLIRSRHPNAVQLTDHTAHRGSAADLVIPSMPASGCSGKPNVTGCTPAHIARVNLPATIPPDVAKALGAGGPTPEGLL